MFTIMMGHSRRTERRRILVSVRNVHYGIRQRLEAENRALHIYRSCFIAIASPLLLLTSVILVYRYKAWFSRKVLIISIDLQILGLFGV